MIGPVNHRQSCFLLHHSLHYGHVCNEWKSAYSAKWGRKVYPLRVFKRLLLSVVMIKSVHMVEPSNNSLSLRAQKYIQRKKSRCNS